jgi:hypothetical protein
VGYSRWAELFRLYRLLCKDGADVFLSAPHRATQYIS